MQSFDAKPISPFPSGSGKTQKTGGGETVWEGAAEEIVTLSHSSLSLPFPAPRGPRPPQRSRGGGGGGGSAKGGAIPASRALQRAAACRRGANKMHF